MIDNEIHKKSIGEDTEETKRDFDLENDSDYVLFQKIESRLGEGESLYKAIIGEAQANESLFLGNVEKAFGTTLAKYKSKTFLNRFYLTIRNLVGLDTDNLPEVQMLPSKDTPPSVKKAEKIKSAIEYGFIRVGFMDFITKCLFDTRIKRDSFGHWFWNYDKNDFDVEPVMIEEITFSPEATTIQDAEWLVYHPLKNRAWWKKNYEQFYDQIAFENVKPVDYTGKGDQGSALPTYGRGSVARLYDYWENDINIRAVYGKDGERIILKKGKNPYFEYRDPFLQMSEWAQTSRPQEFDVASKSGMPLEEALPQTLNPQDVENFEPIVNFLSEARKPFVQFPSMKLLGKLYSTNLMAQGKEALLNYNGKKRQIADNLRGCNVKVVIDSNQFTEESAANVNDEPMQVLRADMQTSPNPVQIVSPTFPELNGLLADMQHDEQYIDDLFGHHEISRGTGDANTMGQDQMNAESDRTPVRMQSRAVESGIKEITEGWIQLIKMFYTEKHWVKKLGGKDGMEMVELINKDVEEGVEPIIVPQSMMKVDKVQRAMALWAQKAIDPYTLFVEMEMPNPKELADRLINFMQFGMISDADPEEIASDMANQSTGEDADGTQQSIERADSENKGFQNGEGEKIPPTPRELVTKEHVSLHFAFYKDASKKMEKVDMDLLEAHATVDKATLVENMSGQAVEGTRHAVKQEEGAKQQAKEQVK